jgi:hypothetical protein
MAFNVNGFRSQMTGDGARPNLFECFISVAGLAVVGAQAASNKFRFMCKSAQLPGSTLGVVTVPYFGREVKFAGNRTFADWTVTIINDEDFIVRKFFERWMNGINAHADNTRDSVLFRPSEYVMDATVLQYSKGGPQYGGVIAAYNFVGMFPTDISAIDLDWGSNDAIEEFTVNFTYQHWTNEQTTDKGQNAFNTVPTEPTIGNNGTTAQFFPGAGSGRS